MYLDQYKIIGSLNNDQNPCFHSPEAYPNFQEDLDNQMQFQQGQKIVQEITVL